MGGALGGALGGGKGSSSSQGAAPEAYADQQGMMQALQMQSLMSAAHTPQQAMPAAPTMPALPTVRKTPVIDWSEKNEQLTNKMRADYGAAQSSKKGRTQTILTSPLLDEDEEEPNLTGSVLAGDE